MSEQSPEELISAIERRFNRQKRLRTFLLELAVSSVVVVSPSTAHIIYEEMHRTDSLPHD
jgi:hypothetical protein